jgi:5-methylcytosine-specific restriction protein A
LEALKTEESRKEGGLKSRYVNYYERRPELRAAAINYHHTVCQVCGFDFEKVYGDRGAGFIEVHHLRPIATLKSATKIDPRKDMSVVCANCHRMIHRKRDHVLSLSELRKLLNNA